MSLKKFVKGLIKCGFKFIKYNYFSKKIVKNNGAYFYPHKNSIIDIKKGGKLILNADFEFNAGKIKNSKAESYLQIDNNGKMVINGNSRINYGSTIHVNPNAILEIGSMTSNVGINIQCHKKISIGKDCMFGRNSTIFDSSFHPTGYSFSKLRINEDDVIIGNHVWVGAYAFIMQGTKIGDGSIIGSKAYVRGTIEPGVLIMANIDRPSASNMIWTRSNEEKSKKEAMNYYVEEKENVIDEEAVLKYSNRIIKCINDNLNYLNINENDDLIDSGKLDSLTTVNLVVTLFDEFKIEIPYSEIKPANFRNVKSIATLIARLKNENECSIDDDYYKVPNSSLKKVSVVEQIYKNSILYPEKVAIISENKEYTYSDLFKLISGYAFYLKSLGLKKGDMLLARSNQTINYIVAYFASHLVGLEITTVEKNTATDAFLSMIEKVSAKAVFTINVDYKNSGIIFLDSFDVLNHVDHLLDNFDFPNENDLADILFTTGTTGVSKGIELTHKGVVCGAENMASGAHMARHTVLICPNPLSHSNAIKNLAAIMISGGTFYVLDGISDLNAFFKALNYKSKKVSLVLPPSGIRTIFQLAKEEFGKYKDKIEYLMAATAPLPEPDRETLRQMFPNSCLYNHYGCSESSTISIYDFNKYKDLKNCVGLATPNTKVMFVNDKREIINSSKDNMGLLAVGGNTVMVGYYKDKKATDEILVDGIVYTKDVGYIDENGFIFITGRNDDVINVGGLKVAPTEVESAAMGIDSIADCICIGVSDKISGQALKLLVVPSNKYEIDKAEIINYLTSKLDNYKVPHLIEIVDHIERTYNGKINRKAYR